MSVLQYELGGVFWMKRAYPLAILFCALAVCAACMTTPADGQVNSIQPEDETTGRVDNPELTDDILALPPGRFQFGVGLNFNGQVQMPPITVKPVLDWSHQTDNPFTAESCLVDSDGGIWMPLLGETNLADLSEMTPNKIRRLNPDGSLDWEKAFLPERESDEPDYSGRHVSNDQIDWDTIYTTSRPRVGAAVALNDAVLISASWIVTRAKKGTSYSQDFFSEEFYRNTSGYFFIECVDLDGNTIWRTDYDENARTRLGSVSRISGNRIVSVINEEYFEIYDLSDGSLVDTVTPDGLIRNFNDLLEGPGGTWYAVLADMRGVRSQKTFSNFNNDGSANWTIEAPVGLNWDLSGEEILAATVRSGIYAYDASSGEALWNIDGFEQLHSCGTTPDGNFIAFDFATQMRQSRDDIAESPMMSISPDGDINWETIIPGNTAGNSNVIIFNDGSILVGHHIGISLLSPDGQVVWTIDFQDLGIEESGVFAMAAASWTLNPFPDGRLVALASGWGVEGYQGYIFSLKPPE